MANTTYTFPTSGSLSIGNLDASDTLEVPSSISRVEIFFLRLAGSDDLIIQYRGGGSLFVISEVIITDHFVDPDQLQALRFSDGTTVDLTGGLKFEAGRKSLNSGIDMQGTDESDFIGGSDRGTNYIYGLGGDDFINSAGGADFVFGGDGNDTLWGGGGSVGGGDVLQGEAGDDSYVLPDNGTVTVIDSSGTDRIILLGQPNLSNLNWYQAAGTDDLIVEASSRYGFGRMVIKDQFVEGSSVEYLEYPDGTIVELPGAGDPEGKYLVFSDGFNRPDGETVGYGWVEVQETQPENPDYLGSSTLNIVDGRLEIDFDAEGTSPARNARAQQPYMTHELSADVGQTGFEISFTFTPGDEERVRHFVGVADSSAGQLVADQGGGRLLIPASGLGIELQRSDSLDPTSGFTLWRFSGDSDFDYENKDGRANEERVGQGQLSFNFENTDEIEVSLAVEGDGSSTVIISNGTTTDTFTGVMPPITETFDEVVISTIEAGHPFYGNQTEIVSFDDLAVYALGEPEGPTPVSTGFALPIGNREGVLATDDNADTDGWFVASDLGGIYNGAYHLGEDWNFTDGDGINDVSDDLGAAVFAASNGKVVYAGPHYGPAKDFDTAFGNLVVIEHLLEDGRTVYSLYAHLNSIEAGIEVGVIIDSTDVQIGELGQTGFAPTPHLHFEIFEGNWQLAVAEIAYVNEQIPEGSSHSVTYTPGQYSWQEVVNGTVVSTLIDHGAETITWYDPTDFILGVGEFGDDEPVVDSGGNGGGTLEGGSGDDVLNGGNGGDVVLGGYGNDQISGGNGGDVISGGGGADIISGGNGGDAIQGGTGNDLIAGGNGADILEGGSGNDQIDGGAGADVIDGGFGEDQIDGAQGDDVIIGGAENDILVGGRGADEFVFGTAFEYDPQNDTILDFEAGDLIVFESRVSEFSQLTITQNGADTVIEYDSGFTITLDSYDSTGLASDDFLFNT